jgi:hypothetical protein
MGFRFRRRIGPKGLKINLTKKGFSSVSIGGKGLTANAPLNRKGGIKYTAGIPGSGMSWEYQEKDTRGTSSISKTSAKPSPALANVMAIAVVLVPIFLVWGCIASVQQSAKKEAQRKAVQAEVAIQAASKKFNEEMSVIKQLVVSNSRWVSALPGGKGLATAKFDITNNSDRTVCKLGSLVKYTIPSGKTQSFSHLVVNGNPCLGAGLTFPFEVMLTNRGFSGIKVGIPPKVTFRRPVGGMF